MHHPERRGLVGLLLLTLVMILCFSPQVQSLSTLPEQQRLAVGEPVKLELDLPEQVLRRMMVSVETSQAGLLQLNGVEVSSGTFGLGQEVPVAVRPGKIVLNLKLFGVIPIKQVAVDVLPETKVWPGGHSIGVVLRSQGVIVIGFSAINGTDGQKHYPARDAGIQVGDVVLAIDGQKVSSDREAARFIDASAGKPVCLRINRKQKEFEVFVNPTLCRETRRYRIGLFIRDGAAGVGTLTFYDPEKGVYGALGHIITDAETNREIDVTHGSIVKASIQGIQLGRKGRPGEKIGLFTDREEPSGSITKNTRFGIFGKLDFLPRSNLFAEPIPVGFANQITVGPAEMLTVISGDRIERFRIAIERVMPQQAIEGKGMVIRITDPRLLKAAGGIVQGMSGSPIVQNGRLIGAVTHVFVNDPTRGYGVLAEWMLMETDIWERSVQRLHQKGGSASLFCM
ncbi:hypothetical protein SY88_07070 [Clostridiales bacterium PH28_bin88]|nr:hypothetical protein SY88_07070 [Clostridiales bacterium PH28_bin88]